MPASPRCPGPSSLARILRPSAGRKVCESEKMRFGKKMRFLMKPRRERASRKRFGKKTLEYLTGKPMELIDPLRHCPPHQSLALWLVIFYFVCNWWFCLVWIKEKDWRFGLVVFFFFAVDWWWWWWWWLWLWLWPMVEVVVIDAVDVFWDSGIYYFIVMFILFYYVKS